MKSVLAWGMTAAAAGGEGIAVAGADFALCLLEATSIPPGAEIATGAMTDRLSNPRIKRASLCDRALPFDILLCPV